MRWIALVITLALVAAAQAEGQDRPAAPVERYQALIKEWSDAAQALWQATTDEERTNVAARVEKLSPRFLELAEKNPNDPIALDSLVQVVLQEIWLQNNTTHVRERQQNPQARAIALLLRGHVRSDKIEEACRRIAYGFSRECETFLRRVLEVNPHRQVQATACLRLAQFLEGRLRRLDLIKEQPELASRYERLFGRDYLEAVRRQDRAEAVKEVEAFFERAAEKYADVKVPFGGTVGEMAKSELYEIRHLSAGKEAPSIEGEDQNGVRFKLSDYRGKVVLLYFWSEF